MEVSTFQYRFTLFLRNDKAKPSLRKWVDGDTSNGSERLNVASVSQAGKDATENAQRVFLAKIVWVLPTHSLHAVDN